MYIYVYMYIFKTRAKHFGVGRVAYLRGPGCGGSTLRPGLLAPRCTSSGSWQTGFRVHGSGFKEQGAGFRVEGSGCRVQGAGCRVQGSGLRVQGAGCRVQGAGCRMQGAGFRVQGWASASERFTPTNASTLPSASNMFPSPPAAPPVPSPFFSPPPPGTPGAERALDSPLPRRLLERARRDAASSSSRSACGTCVQLWCLVLFCSF